MERLLLAVLMGLGILAVGSNRLNAGEPDFSVVGYLPEYHFSEVKVDRLAGLTDLIYFGILPPADGSLPTPMIPEGAMSKLREIQKVHDCRLLVSVGGWDRSESFQPLSTNPTARREFITAMSAWCRDNGFKGIDYDWEHPKDAVELAHYHTLIKDTCTEFHSHDLLVTVAQAPWQNLGKATYDIVDRVHLMSYDQDFPQATFPQLKSEVSQLTQWECPPEKIAMGLPFYGRNRNRESRTYRDLIANPQSPTSDLIDGFAFNGRATIKAKTTYAQKQKLAGVMIWEVSQDSHDDSTSLLKTIRQHLLHAPSR